MQYAVGQQEDSANDFVFCLSFYGQDALTFNMINF